MKCDDARLWDALIDASREAHARGQHAVAYHALAAAMHAADDQSNGEQLGEVEREAKRQLDWIDEYAHHDRLSTRSASTRSHPGVYTLLARTAGAHVQMIVRRADLEHTRQAMTSRPGLS
jgi:hypothetical protein